MKAVITGVAGQDGSYLAELLLRKGYEVHGFARRFENYQNIAHILPQIRIWEDADMIDGGSLYRALEKIRPDEIYHLAAQSFVSHSFSAPLLTSEVTGLGATRLYEAVKELGIRPRIYFAGSSEMFGGGENLTEESSMNSPRSPYGASKLYGFTMGKVYRAAYGMWVTNGILFNHESPRRGSEFVTRRITTTVARMLRGDGCELVLGNLNATRDWGYSPEFVEGMWKMLQLEEPVDLLLCTGEPHSVREFADEAFRVVGLEPRYRSVEEQKRPWDVEVLWGNPAKARRLIGWDPKVKFGSLAKLMVKAELEKMEAVAR